MSREIDIQIAEKVMGWKPFKKRWQDGAHGGYHDSFLDAENKEIRGGLPHYSTRIEDAWTVLGEFHYPKVWFDQRLALWCCEVKHNCMFDMSNGGIKCDGEGYGEHQEAPMAISLAALKAVEER